MKASNASWEKQASRRTVRRRLWFMALSTSELVADSLSASSVGGASGARLVFASASGPGVGTWLVEARLATSPNVVRRGLFILKIARTLICPEGITPGKKRVRYTFAPASQSELHLFFPHGALRPLVGLSPQVRPPVSKTSPAKLGCNQETENTRGRTPIRGTGTSISVTWGAGISPG